MSDRFPITPAGLKRLQEELKHLQSVERPKIAQEIEVARAHGDLRENAEYHAAKEKQGHIEGRIMDLNGWIANAEVIDVSRFKGQDTVLFGATVELMDVENEKKVSYRIVGEFEADLKRRWISVTSPVARGLIGKKVGEVAMVTSPGGQREFEILSVAFEDVG
ncbi:MAG: transcription elongation factor GreA [Myxococcales bacterium]|nr:transcription elongation factor GreA [Myxococcales bacterium]